MDIIVVGGGPAGLHAALRSRELGGAVTLGAAPRRGGICVNTGPARARTLARAARLRHHAADFSRIGLNGDVPQVHVRAVIANATRVAMYANEDLHLTERVRQA